MNMNNTLHNPETEEWVRRVRSIVPDIIEWREVAEENRHLPKELAHALRDAGLFRLWVPKMLGGPEVGPHTMVAVVEELARHDGSVAWTLMASANSALLAAYLPLDGAREVFGPADSIVAGSLHPSGNAKAVSGGFRVTGRWRLASGVLNATWFICTATVQRDEVREGRRGEHIFMIPAEKCRVLDVWNSPGLRGTGTHDFEVEDVFVPAAHHAPPGGHHSFAGPLYGGPLAHFINPPLAAVALGIAREALDEFIQLARTKIPERSKVTLSERHSIHELVGRAEAQIAAGRAYLLNTIDRLWEALLVGEGVPSDLTAQVLVATAYATEQAVRAVDLVFTAAGSTSIVSRNRLERCFRDVHVVNHHDAASPFMFERLGQYILCGR